MENVVIKLMYLGYRTGRNEDGSNYYQGSFIELENNRPVKLYFKDDKQLSIWEPRSDVELLVHFYVNKDGLWKAQVIDA